MADKKSRFDIVITATDRATAVIRKVNQAWSKAMDPVVKTGNAFRDLRKEAGFDKTAQAIGKVARAATDAASKIGSMIAPLTAVTGLSAAGIAAMTVEWGRLGAEVLKTTRIIGLSTSSLQELRGAGRLMNVSNESLTQGMKALGDTMQDAIAGRNQEALMIMGRLGVRMRHTRDGAVDTEGAFLDLASAIARVKNPQVQGLIARTFGLEEALPLLQQGRRGVEELRQMVKETGAVMSGQAVIQASAFTKSMVFLKLSLEGAQNAIAAKLIPVVQPMVEELSRWIIANKEIIATNITEFVKGLSTAIRSIDWPAVVQGVKDFAGAVSSAVGWMGGWQNVIIGVAAVLSINLVTSLVGVAVAAGQAVLQLGLLGGRLAILAASAIPAVINAAGWLAAAVGAEGLAAAFYAVGAAIAATPIGWIIAGVAALSYAAYELYENWEAIAKWWSDLWGGLSSDADKGTKKVVKALSSSVPDRSGAGAPVSSVASQGAWDALDRSRQGGAGGPVRPAQSGAPVTPLTGGPSGLAGLAGGAAALAGEVKVTITFQNPPERLSARTNVTGSVVADVRIDRSMPSFAGN